MSKQLHIRLNDEIYSALSELSSKSDTSIQDTVSAAVMELVSKKKNNEMDDYKFTFIDLFA